MPIVRTAWIDDDGSGTVGTPINNAEKTTLYNQIDGVVEPPWIEVPYLAGNFGATAGTWTVPAQARFGYLRVGKLAHLVVKIDGSTIGGSPESLNIVLPFTLAAGQSGPVYVYANPTFGWGLYEQPSADPYLRLYRDLFKTPWATNAAGVAVRLQLALQLA